MRTDYDIAALLERRAARDEHFRTHFTSPIPEEHLERFEGLEYFDPDPGLVFSGGFAPAEGKLNITSSTGNTTSYRAAGHMDLAIDEESHRLIVLHGEKGDIFIPFRDATSGAGSYGGGRYVPAVPESPETMIIDFNLALNPWCAYDDEFSCPLPPVDNWLRVPIPAGEKDYRPT
jgi:uncharacterized protein (DUF1684 family)